MNTDCAANGGPTISRMSGQINNEMRECLVCHKACRWDMTEHFFFGFANNCPQRADELRGDAIRDES